MHRSMLRGYPPKIIFIRSENCSTSHIFELMKSKSEIIKNFNKQTDESMLTIQ